MASDTGKLFVDTAGLRSGAVSSRQAADNAHDGAAHLAVLTTDVGDGVAW
jgi:hypothetical protein